MKHSRQTEGTVELSGLVVDQIFHNGENGYGVFRLEPDGQGRLVTICGALGQVVPGEHLKAKGQWKDHPRFGEQFVVESSEPCLPNSREGLMRFLGSGLIEGVGPNLAARIVNHFGDGTLSVLSNRSERLKEVKGCGPKKRKAIVDFWSQRQSSQTLLLSLNEHGVGMAQALKIQKAYGDKAMEVLKNQPYRMIQDIPGFGFLVVDRLALRMGMGLNSEQRAGAAAQYLLLEALKDGHCHLMRDEVQRRVSAMLSMDEALVERGVNLELREERLLWIGETLMIPKIYQLEKGICDDVMGRIAGSAKAHLDHHRLAQVLERVQLDLAPSQMEAVHLALQNPFCILTGGPGVGKTTIVKVIVSYWESLGLEPVLAAPTGRASQRMEETTGRKAVTLHRLMKFQPNVGFIHHRNHPLEGRVYVVDEFSMVDIELFHALLDALPRSAHLVMVGDRDQLPSVGPGRILGDLMACGAVPVATLKKVFRQKGNSLLVHNSHRLMTRELPELPKQGEDLKDFYFVDSDDPEHGLMVMKKLITERVPHRFGKGAAMKTQVLSPMKKGALGTIELNLRLQEWLNPEGTVVREDGHGRLKVGDRVVQLVNNYDLELFNGDLGRVVGGGKSHVLVEFEGREVAYEAEALKDISLAYAMTVHKSQGSEYPWVIMPIHRGHRQMLSLELLYTGLTRARSLCVWVGSWSLLQELLDNPPQLERKTLLMDMLKAKLKEKLI